MTMFLVSNATSPLMSTFEIISPQCVNLGSTEKQELKKQLEQTVPITILTAQNTVIPY